MTGYLHIYQLSYYSFFIVYNFYLCVLLFFISCLVIWPRYRNVPTGHILPINTAPQTRVLGNYWIVSSLPIYLTNLMDYATSLIQTRSFDTGTTKQSHWTLHEQPVWEMKKFLWHGVNIFCSVFRIPIRSITLTLRRNNVCSPVTQYLRLNLSSDFRDIWKRSKKRGFCDI